MPEVPQLQTCCFFFSTEIGSKIIGWITTIAGILGVIGYILEMLRIIAHMKPNSSPRYDSGDVIECAIMLVMAVILTLLGVYLLIGIAKRNMRYVYMWVSALTIYLIVCAILVIIRIILIITGRGSADIINQILTLIIEGYFVLVVYSYYRENSGGV